MSKESKQKFLTDRRVMCLFYILLAVYGAACAYLYYHQLFWVDGGPFESDLPFHVRMAVEDHWFYSLTAVVYQIFYLTPFGNELTAVFLAGVSAATVWVTFYLIRQMTQKSYSSGIMLLLAFSGNLIMPFFIKQAHYQRYIGYESASIWHNSTYTVMKLLGILTFSVFWKLSEKYRQGLSLKEWLTFAGLLILCNSVKPSFCIMFAPAMAVFLVAELFRRVPFKRVFLFGLAVVPSLLVILWQNMVLFGEDTGNGIVWNPGYVLAMRGDHPKVTFVLSLAFPLFVLLFTWKDWIKDRLYRFVWLMWLFGFSEIYFLAEAGNRVKDSNFLWGYSMALFFVNLLAMKKLVDCSRKKDGIFAYPAVRFLFTGGGIACLGYQVWCGIFFFCRLLTGETYWM